MRKVRLLAPLAAALAAAACSGGAGTAQTPAGVPRGPGADEARVSAILPFGGAGAWVGTFDGTLALIGARITVSETPTDPAWGSVRALAAEADALVVAAGSGLFRLGGSGWEVLEGWRDGALPLSLDGSPEGVWVGRGDPRTGVGSLALAGGGSWDLRDHTTVIASASMVREVVAEAGGGVWVATNAAGVARRGPAGEWQLYDLSTGALRSDRVSDLAGDPLGGVWVATARGVARLAAEGHEAVVEEALPDPRARAVAATVDAVWVGTAGGGVARLDRGAGAWQVVRPALPGRPAVTGIVVAADGTAWVGTAGDGVLGFAADGSPLAGAWEGEPYISALAVAGDVVWVGSHGGLAYRLVPAGGGVDTEVFQVVDGVVPVSPPAAPDPIQVPAGWFLRGSDAHRPDEAPPRRVYLDAFSVARSEVTNAEYLAFMTAVGAPAPASWPGGAYLLGQARHPVAGLRAEEAAAYCAWVAGRLPTEAEWEKAARGTDGRTWPWGDEWDPARANTVESGRTGPVAVGSFPGGASPYGALDMAGNLEEWVADYYQADYYSVAPDHNPAGPDLVVNRVRRGGSWAGDAGQARTSYRTSSHGSSPDFRAGFRCAWD